jgi:hypothetical protein
LAIISAMVRRSSSVMPGSAAGGARRIDVPGWSVGPTVIQRIVPWPMSLRTSKPMVVRRLVCPVAVWSMDFRAKS